MLKEANGDYLSMQTYIDQAWWVNTESYSESFGWLNAGFRTAEVNLVSQKITFERIMDAPTEQENVEMKTAIVYASVHHGNTKKIIDAIAKENEVELIDQ